MVRIFTLYGKMMAKWAMVSLRTKYILTFLTGLIIGLLVLGWWLWPVQWTSGAPVDLAKGYRDFYLRAIAIAYSSNAVTADDLQKLVIGDKWSVAGLLQEVERLSQESPNPDIYVRLKGALEFMKSQQSPGATATATPGDTGGGITPLALVGVVLAVALVVLVSLALVRRINQPARTQAARGMGAGPGGVAEGVAVRWHGETEPPLREFTMKYELGDDHFDLSHAIETATGMFLGECGMGISETLNASGPKRVTAFEVWLFDKNDIRTVTSVLMSEHAYADPALKAKLAAKGDLVLAEPSAAITIETQTLRVRARVTEMEYGIGQLPENSFFSRLHVVLAAWPLGDGGTTQPGDVLRN